MLLFALQQAALPESRHAALALVLVFALALALPISLILILLYRRAVSKSMNVHTARHGVTPLPVPSSPAPETAQPSRELSVVDATSLRPGTTAGTKLYSEIRHAPWRAATVYLLAGTCYAFILTIAIVYNQGFFPIRFLSLLWILLWPMVLTANLVAAATRRSKAVIVIIYFLILAVLTALTLAFSPEASWFTLVWGWFLFNIPATLVLSGFLNRAVRAVGPFVLIFMIVAVTGALLAIFVLTVDEIVRAFVGVVSIVGLGASSVLVGFTLAGFFIAWPIGWLVLKVITKLYQRKKVSDQSIAVDTIWLTFAVFVSLYLASNGILWIFSGLIAFLSFKVGAWIGFRLLRNARATTQAPRLLVLRVFSLGKRSENLFGALATHWRHAGSIELIAGPDLATNTLEPHEFLDFVSGKLARNFIDGPQALERRRSEMDTKPDQDGRFRVNDFFCHSDTWQMVLSRLGRESNAVLMDLRGFSSRNQGCIFEVNELINVAQLGRVVFVVDETTDHNLLLAHARQSWTLMRPQSPNLLPATGGFQLFNFRNGRDLRRLLRALCTAANPT